VTRDVAIRTASPADAPRLAALLAAGTLRGGEDATDVASYRRALEEIAVTDGNEVLVAERHGEVVGMCQLIMFRHLQGTGRPLRRDRVRPRRRAVPLNRNRGHPAGGGGRASRRGRLLPGPADQ
jgi:hypothetical protein